MEDSLTPRPPLHCGEGEETTGRKEEAVSRKEESAEHKGIIRDQKISPKKL